MVAQLWTKLPHKLLGPFTEPCCGQTASSIVFCSTWCIPGGSRELVGICPDALQHRILQYLVHPWLLNLLAPRHRGFCAPATAYRECLRYTATALPRALGSTTADDLVGKNRSKKSAEGSRKDLDALGERCAEGVQNHRKNCIAEGWRKARGIDKV